MEQFVAIAIAHFLALLIPGVDFFLIARTAMTSGWRNATGACLGIATANGIFIAAAFSGVSLISHPVVREVVQLAGGGFLISIGVAFLRSTASIDVEQSSGIERGSWARNYGLGITSGLLNPKNALFYISLAAAVATTRPSILVAYGVWMFAIVLVWDVFVAVVFGSRPALARMERVLPWLTKIAGIVLILFGVAMVAGLVAQRLP